MPSEYQKKEEIVLCIKKIKPVLRSKTIREQLTIILSP